MRRKKKKHLPLPFRPPDPSPPATPLPTTLRRSPPYLPSPPLLEVATPEKTINSKLSPICKSASQVVSSRVQLTLHATRSTPHGAARFVQATSA